MSSCHTFRPVPGHCGPNRRGPVPAPPFNPQDYWATRKFVSSLFESIKTKIDKFDVVDPSAEAEAGKAADAKSTYEELNRILGVASDARVLAESKADKATTLSGYGITDAATKAELAAKADLVDGKVPASQLPSYVDDVLEYDTMSVFPATGESGKIYVAKDTNLVYRWSGTQYVEISPSPVLDDTVTETSPNGVKSSGIWSWVTNLLTGKLDKSDVIKQSDVTDSTPDGKAADAKDIKAKLDDKRDKDDLAVYEVVRTENTDWTWTSVDSEELAAVLNANGAKPVYVSELFSWDCTGLLPDGWIAVERDPVNPQSSTRVDLGFSNPGQGISIALATATRPRYMDESIEPKDDQQLAAVATGDAAKPADGDLVKYDAANDRLVKATAGTDYLKEHQDISGKRDLTDNTCHKTEFTEWTFYPSIPTGYTLRYEQNVQGFWGWFLYDASGKKDGGANHGGADPDVTNITVPGYEWSGGYSFTATRSAACTDGKKFVTDDVVDGKVSSAVSTNNPAFVSAVQNTPTSGMPEDMPTDWGAFGTVGAALAALAAGLKWCKNILGSLASGYSTFAAWIASKLDRASLLTEYSATSAYSVGAIVCHDGSIYQCNTAIAEGGEAWNGSHWELRKLADFFTGSNGLLTGTIDAEIVEKGTAPDAHLEAPTDEHLKLILADNSVAYDSAKALPYKLTSAIGDRVIATMTLTAASTDITLPTIAANDTTVKDFILDVTNAYAVEGVATDAGINIPRTDFKLVTRDGESLTDVTTVKAGKSAFLCFTQKSPVVVDGTTYPCWCVIQLPFGDPS